MLRWCNGEDVNLIRSVATGMPLNGFVAVESSGIHPDYEPCACGLRFNDVDRSVIFPHAVLGGMRVVEEVRAA